MRSLFWVAMCQDSATTEGQISGSSPQPSAGEKRHVKNITERPKVLARKNDSLGEN